MADNWDDSDDDDWDVDDDALDAKLGLNKKAEEPVNNFDDEEDLALKEKAEQDRLNQISLKKKGSALAAKKQAEKDRADDLEIARKALELEAEMEANMTIDERKMLERKRQEEAELEMMGDAFGGGLADGGVGRGAQKAGDKVVMKDMKDHMKHARKVADCMKVSKLVILVFFSESNLYENETFRCWILKEHSLLWQFPMQLVCSEIVFFLSFLSNIKFLILYRNDFYITGSWKDSPRIDFH